MTAMADANRIELDDLNEDSNHTSRLRNLSSGFKQLHNLKPSSRKYLMLLIYIFCYSLNTFQWLYLCSITDKLMIYYETWELVIYATAMIYMIAYILLIIPTINLFNKFDLKYSLLVATIGSILAASVKYIGSHQFIAADARLIILVSGQIISALCQLLLHSLSPRIAVIWFPNQVSIIKTVSYFGGHLGTGFSFIIPGYVIGTSSDLDTIERGLLRIHLGLGFCLVLMLIVVISVFENRPQHYNEEIILQQNMKLKHRMGHSIGKYCGLDNQVELWEIVKQYKKDFGFFFLILCYGTNLGTHVAISILMNGMITSSWRRNGLLTSRLGFIMYVSSFLGAIASAYTSIKMLKFQTGHALLYGFNVCFLMLVAMSIREQGNTYIYWSFFLFGFFMSFYQVIAFELGNENTWPKPENLTIVLLEAASMGCAITFTIIGCAYRDNYGSLFVNAILVLFIFIGFVFSFFMSLKHKRKLAYENQMPPRPGYRDPGPIPRFVYPNLKY